MAKDCEGYIELPEIPEEMVNAVSVAVAQFMRDFERMAYNHLRKVFKLTAPMTSTVPGVNVQTQTMLFARALSLAVGRETSDIGERIVRHAQSADGKKVSLDASAAEKEAAMLSRATSFEAVRSLIEFYHQSGILTEVDSRILSSFLLDPSFGSGVTGLT